MSRLSPIEKREGGRGGEPMLRNKHVGFVGSGNMGEALVNGLLHGHLCRPEQILCEDDTREIWGERNPS
jgi:hypothetical protein